MMVSVLFVNPKNHGISKLVLWRSKRTLRKTDPNPLFFGGSQLILMGKKIFLDFGSTLPGKLTYPHPFGSSEKSVKIGEVFFIVCWSIVGQKTWSQSAEKYRENPKINLRSHPQGPLEGGPPDVSPTVYVSEFLSFWGWKGKFGVSSQGMWAKSLNKGFGRWCSFSKGTVFRFHVPFSGWFSHKSSNAADVEWS